MDDLMELILEVLVEGGAAAMGSRRVPLPVRVAIGAVLTFLMAVLLVSMVAPPFVSSLAYFVWIKGKCSRQTLLFIAASDI